MKGREVVDKLKGHVDPRVIACIANIAEEQHAMGRGLKELAAQVDRVASLMQAHTSVLEENMGAIKEIRSKIGGVQSVPTGDA